MRDYLPPISEGGWRWVRFGAVVVAAVGLIWLIISLQAVFTPLVVGLTLAYILNPVVNLLQHRGLGRLAAVTLVFVGAGVIALSLGLWLAVIVYQQTTTFATALPRYVEQTETWLQETYPGFMQQFEPAPPEVTATPEQFRTWLAAHDPAIYDRWSVANEPDWTVSDHLAWLAATDPSAYEQLEAELGKPPPGPGHRFAAWLQQNAGLAQQGAAGLATVGNALLGLTGLLTLAVLIPMYTFFFLLQFDPLIRTVRDYLPGTWRPVIVQTVKLIDEKTADFFRGRLIVCALVGVLTGVGWFIVGVPYSLAFGLAVGVLNLVPFLPMIMLPPVLLATYVHVPPNESWVIAVTLATGVFAVVQGIESFLLYPYFSARSSGLHPVTTIVALLIGGEVAGLLGMLLSIPVASTLKSLGSQYLLPEIRRLAAEKPEDQTPEARRDE
jgi:predicted PurR-regulated permease PerM